MPKFGVVVFPAHFIHYLFNTYPDHMREKSIEYFKKLQVNLKNYNIQSVINYFINNFDKEILEEYLYQCTQKIIGQKDSIAKKCNLYLNIDEIKVMMQNQIEFGNHSKTHPILSGLDYKEQKYEIEGAKYQLEKLLKQKIKYFAYPVGCSFCFNETTKKILEDSGHQNAFIVGDSPSESKFEIERIPIYSQFMFSFYSNLEIYPKIKKFLKKLIKPVV